MGALWACSAGVAHGKSPYMWGVGGYVGTKVLPGAYPFALPPRINQYDMDDDGERDVDSDGNELETTLERVRFEIEGGGNGVYYIDKYNRVGGQLGARFGKRYFDISGLAKYHRVATQGDIDFLYGGGIGFGYMRLQGEDEDEVLKVPYYPLRVEAIPQYRQDEFNLYACLWGQFAIPARHVYTDRSGTEVDVGAPFNYLSLGIDIGVQFGDFKPPRKKKRGRK